MLPKTGSSNQQNLFFTISGIVLLLLTLILFKKTNRNGTTLGGKK
ncbi:LPXTG cell wall anchor domain-containing protein [Enterococcus raffinosus]